MRISLIVILALVSCLFTADNVTAADRPNILTVFIDDMGWSDLSSYGGTRTETENIDRLANEGLRFTNFYVMSPICSPSRVALSTGQYPARWRITSYLNNRNSNRERGVAQWLDLEAPMLARELNKAGYATGHFGKWHMGGQRDVGEAPLITEYGFDASLTNFEGLGPRVLPLKDAYDGKPPQKHALGSDNLGRGPIRWEDRSVVTAAFVEDAIKFIDQSQEDGKPFFVNLWPDDVHSPFFPPEVLRDKTDESKRALYYAVLDAMDQQLAKLFDRIRNDEKLRDNTLIVVMSDNGHEEGAGSSDPLRGAKTWLYEGGVRSPLIVWGPGLVDESAKGTTNDKSILCTLDLNRSLYEIAGVAVAEGVTLDGEPLAETIQGKAKASREQPIFWRRPPDRPGTKDNPNPDLAVRDGQWKFLVDFEKTTPQLYDLSSDQSESNNVSSQNPDVVERLQKAVFAWNAQLPVDASDPSFEQPIAASVPPDQFVNPIGEGADPWIVRDEANDRYLWCDQIGNRGLVVRESQRLTSLGTPHVVWDAPKTGPVSQQVWAPELHRIGDRWYIYFAASDGDNANHLAYVLASDTEDPLGSYTLHGPLATGDGADGRSPNIWAIDMTVLEHERKLYAIWSGWDAPGTDQQYLYIAPMSSPTEISGPRVLMCDNDDYLWERVEPGLEHRGLAEAPEVLKTRNRTLVMYSCGASWLPTYKLGMLELTGKDPLDPKSWTKRAKPVFESTAETYGVGHSCFVKDPEGRNWWHVFHAKVDREPGWRRAIYVQPMQIGKRGYPVFGKPVAPGTILQRPRGEVRQPKALPFEASLKGKAGAEAFSYLGHNQFIDWAEDGLHLGTVPDKPINEYRSGEKVVLNGLVPDDVEAEVSIRFENAQSRDAGILFRCSGSSVGYDAQRGYFAGLIPRTSILVVGRMDGQNWKELARADVVLDTTQLQRLTVKAVGSRFEFAVNGEHVFACDDAMYKRGTVGLRVVNTHAVFSDFAVRE